VEPRQQHQRVAAGGFDFHQRLDRSIVDQPAIECR
jgi:hypothetical protein